MALHKDHGLRAENLYSWTSGGYLHERAYDGLSPGGAYKNVRCNSGDRNPPLLGLWRPYWSSLD